MDKRAVVPQHVGIHEHFFGAAILAANCRFIAVHHFATRQSPEHIVNHIAIDMKLGDLMTDVFIATVPQHPQLGLVRAQNSSVRPHPVMAKHAIFKKITELPFLPPKRILGALPLRNIFTDNQGERMAFSILHNAN